MTQQTPASNRMTLAERYKIYNSIYTFQPFQTELMEKLAEFKRVAISIGTGVGKTTVMKYLSLDFVDINPTSSRSLILVNTRALTYDIGESLNEILDDDERGIVCNLCEYDATRHLSKQAIDRARIFIAVPDKYIASMNRLPRHFQFVCVDEVDALLDRDEPDKSSVIRILSTITFNYSIACSATLTQEVYTHIIDKFDYVSKEFRVDLPKIETKRINYEKSDKHWHAFVCDKIHHIILENPLKNKVLVFCNSRIDCDRLYAEYKTSGALANYCIHGKMTGAHIQELFKSYKANGKVLFTTDMCQRGLDVKDIDIVFHVGVTGDTEFYHRNGRTLRKSDTNPLCFLFVQSHDIRDYPALADIPERYFDVYPSHTRRPYNKI